MVVSRSSSSSFEGIHSRSDTNRTGAEGLSSYNPKLLHCLNQMLAVMLLSTSSRSSFEGYPLQIRRKQDWGRGFILLLPQAAALPESDAGSGVIKPASSFVIQNRQILCSMWCPIYRANCLNIVCGLLRGVTLAIR